MVLLLINELDLTRAMRTFPPLLCSLTTGTTGLSLLSLPLSLRPLDPCSRGVELISMQMLPFSSILRTCNNDMDLFDLPFLHLVFTGTSTNFKGLPN